MHSYCRVRGEYEKVRVEVHFAAGLPQFSLLGQPDPHLNEGLQRIKIALKSQGFSLPLAKQVVFNIVPSQDKKSSSGLELALAIAYLINNPEEKNGLDPFLFHQKELHVFGGLSLSGKILPSQDLYTLPSVSESTYLLAGGTFDNTGEQDRRLQLPGATLFLDSLSDLRNGTATAAASSSLESRVVRPLSWKSHWQRRKPVEPKFWTDTERDLLLLLSVGRHSALLAGPAGSGKTSLAQEVVSLLGSPEAHHVESWRRQGDPLQAPCISPHHTTPTMALLGGGNHIFRGELARAHGGVLVLDEFLEFKAEVRESLREVIESHSIRVTRSGETKVFPLEAVVIGATNLCPCGDFIPGRPSSRKCVYSLARCQSVIQRLTGPLLDRFQVLFFTQPSTRSSSQKLYSREEILEKIDRALEWKEQRGQNYPYNCQRDGAELRDRLGADGKLLLGQDFEGLSQRRRLAQLRVAASWADLDGSDRIQLCHLKKAAEKTIAPFLQWKKLE